MRAWRAVTAGGLGSFTAGLIAVSGALGSAFPGTNGPIVYDQSGAIYSAPSTGGTGSPLTSPPAGFSDFQARFSADGNDVVFVRGDNTGGGPGHIEVTPASGAALYDLSSQYQSQLPANTTPETPSFTPAGCHIVFATLDYMAGQNTGISQINTDGTGYTQLAHGHYSSPTVSSNGMLAYVSLGAGTSGGDQVVVANADGSSPHAIYNSSGRVYGLDWSPDASRLAFSDNKSIYIINSAGPSSQTAVQQTTPDASTFDTFPAWSPDGAHVLFTRTIANHTNHTETASIYKIDTAGTPPQGGTQYVAGTGGADASYPDWGPAPATMTSACSFGQGTSSGGGGTTSTGGGGGGTTSTGGGGGTTTSTGGGGGTTTTTTTPTTTAAGQPRTTITLTDVNAAAASLNTSVNAIASRELISKRSISTKVPGMAGSTWIGVLTDPSAILTGRAQLARTVILGRGSVRFTSAGSQTLRIPLNRQFIRALRRLGPGKRLRVTLKLTYAPPKGQGAPITVTTRFTVVGTRKQHHKK